MVFNRKKHELRGSWSDADIYDTYVHPGNSGATPNARNQPLHGSGFTVLMRV